MSPPTLPSASGNTAKITLSAEGLGMASLAGGFKADADATSVR